MTTTLLATTPRKVCQARKEAKRRRCVSCVQVAAGLFLFLYVRASNSLFLPQHLCSDVTLE